MYRSFFVACILLCSSWSFGQGEANSLEGVPFKERIVFGGGVGLSFGNVQDFISVSPQVGYRVTARLLAGSGFTYRYTNYKYLKVKLSDYGISPFLRFTVYKNIFVQTEYEYLNYEFPYVSSSATETIRRDFNSVFVGGGFVQPVGQKLSFYIMALYNLSYKETTRGVYSPYDSPLVIRAGINIGNLGF